MKLKEMETMEKEKEITLAEAADMLGVQVATVRQWIKSGKMQGRKKWGTRWVVSIEEVERRKKDQ